MKFMFSAVYRVTQKDFYARLYTSMCARVVARQISKTIFKLLPRVYQHVRCYKLKVLLPGPLDLRIWHH